MRICAKCGVSIEGYNPRSYRCKPCQRRAELDANNLWRRRYRRSRAKGAPSHVSGGRRWKPIRERCAVCGVEKPDRPTSLRCAECQRLLRNQRMRDWRRKNLSHARAYDRARQPGRRIRERERYATEPSFRDSKRYRAGSGKRWDIRFLAARDGTKCAHCGQELGDLFDGRQTHVDHIRPVSKGGISKRENLRLLHSFCNMSRGNRA